MIVFLATRSRRNKPADKANHQKTVKKKETRIVDCMHGGHVSLAFCSSSLAGHIGELAVQVITDMGVVKNLAKYSEKELREVFELTASSA
eukprot:6479493-Amphidinium_carterae.1